MSKQSAYEEYMKNFEAKGSLEPANMTYVNSFFNNIPHKMLVFKTKSIDTSAYATRSKNFGLSGIYNIYINPNFEKSKNGLELHEKGHIILGHLVSNTFNDRTFQMKVKFAWPRIRKFIEVNKDVKMSEKEIQDIYIKKVSKILLNYAMDYEVNSKLFTKEEYDTFEKLFENDYMTAALNTEEMPEDVFEKCVSDKIADPTIKIVSGLWPEDVNFPLKLQFTQYIDLMIADPEKFFKKIKLARQKPNAGGQSDEEGTQSDESSGSSAGDDQSKSDSSKSSSNSNANSDETISLSDIDDLANEFNDMDEEAMKKLQEAAEAAEDDEDEGASDIADAMSSLGESYSPVAGNNKRNGIIDVKKSRVLEKKVLEAVFNKVIFNARQDPVYNYNRKKYNSDVLVPKAREEQLWRPGNIVLLVDCSGSINDNAISAMISCVKQVAKKCGPKSRIVWWDTQLRGDYPLRKNKGPSYYGGTDIARGITYVKQHYLKQSNDKLIIISDYYDSLEGWMDILSSIKNDVVGLCWLHASGNENTKEYISNFIDDSKVNAFLKKLPTTLVNIS